MGGLPLPCCRHCSQYHSVGILMRGVPVVLYGADTTCPPLKGRLHCLQQPCVRRAMQPADGRNEHVATATAGEIKQYYNIHQLLWINKSRRRLIHVWHLTTYMPNGRVGNGGCPGAGNSGAFAQTMEGGTVPASRVPVITPGCPRRRKSVSTCVAGSRYTTISRGTFRPPPLPGTSVVPASIQGPVRDTMIRG